ncbi:MAG: HAD-IC family P-type ATPase, partial [Halanaerobiales bacterium]
ELKSYREISGRGIKAVVDGKDILVGNANLLKEREIDFDEFSGADTVVYVAVNEEYKGYITISDSLKDDAVKAIKELKENGIEEIIMLTGDREEVAERISKTLGVDDYRAELLPDEKVEMVENILKEMSEGDKLAFVGDGINDAPVLARSDIGIAMGALGSDAAIEAADIVLMSDEPYQVVKARETASLTRNIVWQNIIMALGIKLAVMGLGVVGMASMWEAVFADVGVALLAVFNAMRILRVK